MRWFTFLLAAMLLGQQQTDWIASSNNPDIRYHEQVFARTKACYLEFRDLKQGSGYTTFDADVDYSSTDLNSKGQPAMKTDSEHIATAPAQTGPSRIANCSAVLEVRVSFVQRH